MGWYFEVLKKYALFSGRARRMEYWYFALFNFLITLALALVAGLASNGGNSAIEAMVDIYSLVVLVPSLAVSVRRLHDTNKSGWWLLIGLIPLLGAIVLIIFFVEDSQRGPNRFGPNPKELAAAQIVRV